MCEHAATAMVFHHPGERFEKKEIEYNTPAPGEVIVKIHYTTICSSDLHTFSGRRISPSPSILGHEIIGTVENTGGVVKDFDDNELTVGDMITWCIYAFDRNTRMAKKGIPQKAEGLYKYGHHQLSDTDTLNGGFATHCILRQGTAIFKLPKKLTLRETAPLNCTHATIAGAIRTAGDIVNKKVMVVGAGMLGLSACAMAHHEGAAQVYAMDINPVRLAFAKEFGVSKFFSAEASVEKIKSSLTEDDQIDIIIDTSGIPSAMEKGLQLLTIGGIVVWVGAVFSQPATQVNAEMVIRNLLTIKGIHNYIPQDLSRAVRFLNDCSEKYPFEQLVGAEYPLEKLDDAFESAMKNGFYRVGVRMMGQESTRS